LLCQVFAELDPGSFGIGFLDSLAYEVDTLIRVYFVKKAISRAPAFPPEIRSVIAAEHVE